MKILLAVVTFLGFAGVSSSEPIRCEITVSPIGASNKAIKVNIDGDTLTIKRGVGEAVVFRPTPKEAKLLRAAIIASSAKDWGGFWASMDYLDGSILGARLERDGKEITFNGWNGCPDGFAAVLARINQITKSEIFSNNWKEMEGSAKRYKSFEEFTETTPKAAQE